MLTQNEIIEATTLFSERSKLVTMPLLKTALISKEHTHSTDLNAYYIGPTLHLATGCYDIKELNTATVGLVPKRVSHLDEFPSAPDITKAKSCCHATSAELYRAFKRVAIAMSNDSYSHNIYGVFLENENLIATNGHMLLKYSISVKILNSAILPRSAVINLYRWLKMRPDNIISIYQTAQHTCFATDLEKVIIRHIDDQFPKYRSVIPEKTVPVMHIADPQKLVKQLTKILHTTNKLVSCKLVKDGLAVHAATCTTITDSVKTLTLIEDYGIRADYLINAIGKTKDPITLEMGFGIKTPQPFVIQRPLELAVIMPVNLKYI